MRREFLVLIIAYLLLTRAIGLGQNNQPGEVASAAQAANALGDETAPLVNDLESRIDPVLLPHPSPLPDDFYKAHAPAKGCDVVSEHTKLAHAWAEYKDVHLDAAVNQFSILTASCDPRVRYVAVLSFGRTHDEMSEWWWQLGRYVPPVRWSAIDFPRRILFCAFFAMIIVAALKALRPGFERAVLDHYEQNPPKRVTIMTPNALTTGDTASPEVNFFAAMLQDSCDEVGRRLSREGMGLQVGAASFLSVSSSTADSLRSSIPTIKGVDLNGFAKFFFYVVRYFSPRIESQVALCPPPAKGAEGLVIVPGSRLVAYATMRVAWVAIGDPCFVDLVVDNRFDIDDAVFFLAAQILGNRRPDGESAVDFPDQKSFSHYLQGLGAMLLYEQEAARKHPRSIVLERWMQLGLNRLRKCAVQEEHGQHEPPVTRFSYGLLLAMRNQEVYVERLQEIEPACVAVGRRLGFIDLISQTEVGQHEQLLQCASAEREFSRPYYALEESPWPYISESATVFEGLIGGHEVKDPSLKDRARYNLALAHARRGREDELQKASDQLRPLLEGNGHDSHALNVQFDILRKSVEIRLLIVQDPKRPRSADKHVLVAAQVGPVTILEDVDVDRSKRVETIQERFKEFKKFREQIPRNLAPAERRDLIADHLTQEGHIYLDCATSLFSVDGSTRAEELLEHAARDFNLALAIKPNWNPAQIYLALTRRIQSGLAGAYVDHLGSCAQEREKNNKEDQNTDKSVKNVAGGGSNEAKLPSAGKIDQPATEKARQSHDTYRHDRDSQERLAQKEWFSREADNLFAALHGDPWPVVKSDSEASAPTAKPGQHA